MKKTYISMLASAALLVGCGGSADTTTWTVSNLNVVSDGCELNDPMDPLAGLFDITIDGSTVTFAHTTLEIEGTSTTFSEQDNEVIATNSREDSTSAAPCTAKLDDAFTISVTDEDRRLENNSELQVSWNHQESDVSSTPGACGGNVWFVDLPCTSVLTFTLTKN